MLNASLTNVSAGYKFETLSLLPQPWDETSREFIEARETAIVNNHAQYCSVVKTVIGKNTKLILGGEVDASMSSFHIVFPFSSDIHRTPTNITIYSPQYGTANLPTSRNRSTGSS